MTRPPRLLDLLAPDLDVLLCALNPGLQTAATGHHFTGRQNRFWPTMYRAGFTSTLVDAPQSRLLLENRVGLTPIVRRPTATAAEISREEYVAGAAALLRKIKRYRPLTVAFMGKAAYGAIVGKSQIEWGRQTEPFGGVATWVLPNTSGLNRSFSLDDLVYHYTLLKTAIDQLRDER